MNPLLLRVLHELEEFSLTFDVDKANSDPYRFTLALLKVMPFLLEHLRDHYDYVIEMIKFGGTIDELES